MSSALKTNRASFTHTHEVKLTPEGRLLVRQLRAPVWQTMQPPPNAALPLRSLSADGAYVFLEDGQGYVYRKKLIWEERPSFQQEPYKWREAWQQTRWGRQWFYWLPTRLKLLPPAQRVNWTFSHAGVYSAYVEDSTLRFQQDGTVLPCYNEPALAFPANKVRKHSLGSGILMLYELASDRRTIVFRDTGIPLWSNFYLRLPESTERVFVGETIGSSGSLLAVLGVWVHRPDADNICQVQPALLVRAIDSDLLGWNPLYKRSYDYCRALSTNDDFRVLPPEPWQQVQLPPEYFPSLTLLQTGMGLASRRVRMPSRDGSGWWERSLATPAAPETWTFQNEPVDLSQFTAPALPLQRTQWSCARVSWRRNFSVRTLLWRAGGISAKQAVPPMKMILRDFPGERAVVEVSTAQCTVHLYLFTSTAAIPAILGLSFNRQFTLVWGWRNGWTAGEQQLKRFFLQDENAMPVYLRGGGSSIYLLPSTRKAAWRAMYFSAPTE